MPSTGRPTEHSPLAAGVGGGPGRPAPIDRLTVPNGTVLMTSLQSGGELLKGIHRKDAPDNLAFIRAKASCSGLWVYKEDHTGVGILGALAKIAAAFLTLDGVCQA